MRDISKSKKLVSPIIKVFYNTLTTSVFLILSYRCKTESNTVDVAKYTPDIHSGGKFGTCSEKKTCNHQTRANHRAVNCYDQFLSDRITISSKEEDI